MDDTQLNIITKSTNGTIVELTTTKTYRSTLEIGISRSIIERGFPLLPLVDNFRNAKEKREPTIINIPVSFDSIRFKFNNKLEELFIRVDVNIAPSFPYKNIRMIVIKIIERYIIRLYL
ncbi:MAG: hypothetical protein SNI46_00330 [Rikenellaceae bacterium]